MKLFYTKSEFNELKNQLKEMTAGRDAYKEILEDISIIIKPILGQTIVDRTKEIVNKQLKPFGVQVNHVNKMKTSKKERMIEALTCLYLQCPQEVCDDVKSKVMDAFEELENQKLPSKYAPNDPVELEFYKGGRVKNCEIQAIKFTKGKVRYDVAVLLMESTHEEKNDSRRWTVVKNVDSVCVVDPE